MLCGLAMNLSFRLALGRRKRLPAQDTGGLYKTHPRQGRKILERGCADSIGIIADNEQLWPGRAILEYDSRIQGCEGCGPNFDYF